MATGRYRIRIAMAAALTVTAVVFASAGSASATPGDISVQGGGTNQWCITEDGRDGNGVENACIDGKGLDSGVSAVQVTPDGKRLHVTGFNGFFGGNGNGMLTFDRDPTTGFVDYDPRPASCFSDAGIAPCVGSSGAGYLAAPTGIAISPDSNNVYVSARASSAVSVFDYLADLEATSGPLIPKASPNGCLVESASGSCSDVRGLAAASDIVMAPDGETVYTAGRNASFGGIAVFDRASDGVLTQKLLTAGCVNDSGISNGCTDGNEISPKSISISADGKNLYAVSYFRANFDDPYSQVSLTVFDINPDGSIIQKAGSDGCFTEAGSGGSCSSFPLIGLPDDISISPDGKSVYVVSDLPNFEDFPDVSPLTAFDRNTETGALTLRGCFAAEGALGCTETAGLYRPVTVTATDEAVYVGSLNRNADATSGEGAAPSALVILNRDPANGNLTQKPFDGCWAPDPLDDCVELSTLSSPRAIGVSPDGANLYVGGSSGITIFNRDNGVEPETTIDSGPTGEITEAEATFNFSADKPVGFYECAIDSDLFLECESPVTFQSLSLGPHTVKVRATDKFDRVETTPAEQTFTVIAEPTCETDASLCPPTCETDPSLCPPPTCETDPSLCPPEDKVVKATVTAAKVQRIKGRKIVIAVKIRAGEALTAKLTGSLKKGKRKTSLKPVTRKLKAGTTTTIKLRPAKARAGRNLAAALRGGKRSVPKIFITLTDGATNRVTRKPKITLKGPKR